MAKHPGRGRPPADDRKVLNGILWVLLTGNPWQAIPPQYGSYSTCWRRFKSWSADGTWERVWGILLHQLNPEECQMWSAALLAGYFIPAKGTRLRSLAHKD